MSVPSFSPSAVTAALHWRYATKRFDPERRIPAEVWEALEQSLVLAPSSFGLQPWRFYVVTDPGLKARLPAVSWDQDQPRDCSHHVVLTRPLAFGVAEVDRYVARAADVSGRTRESLAGYRGMMLESVNEMAAAGTLEAWMERQVYIALGFLMETAALLGVDACPMEGIVRAEYDRLLGLGAEGQTSVVACALGYRAEGDKYASAPKVRYPVADLVRRIG